MLALLYYEFKYTSYVWQLFYYVLPYIAYRFSWLPIGLPETSIGFLILERLSTKLENLSVRKSPLERLRYQGYQIIFSGNICFLQNIRQAAGTDPGLRTW